jgi:hypothetical protein
LRFPSWDAPSGLTITISRTGRKALIVQRVLEIAKHENRKLALRPVAEILDALDLICRQHRIAQRPARKVSMLKTAIQAW